MAPTISFTFVILLALELVCNTHLFAQVVAEFEGTTYNFSLLIMKWRQHGSLYLEIVVLVCTLIQLG